MSLIKYIDKLFSVKDENGYKTIYVMVDIHNTILVPSFDHEETFVYFPYAKETLQILSQLDDVKLILWTSSHKDKIEMYINHFNENGIVFDYANENPEFINMPFANFSSKFYYDIGIDDKFGFDANGGEWKMLYDFFLEYKLKKEK